MNASPDKAPDDTQPTQAGLTRRLAGVAILALGFLALTAPWVAGKRAPGLLGLLLLGSGLLRTTQIFAQRANVSAFFSGTFSFLSGLLLLAAPGTALSGLVWLLGASFVLDGAVKLAVAIWRVGRTGSLAAL